MLSPIGMFLLQQIADADSGVLLSEVAQNVRSGPAWLALARLLRAGLIDENGRSLYATESGRLAADFTESLGRDGP